MLKSISLVFGLLAFVVVWEGCASTSSVTPDPATSTATCKDQWDQGSPSYFALVPTLVFAKYFEVGMSFAFKDGSIEKYITIGLSANAENLTALVTGKTISTRLQSAKLAYAEEQERKLAKADYHLELIGHD
jgi:hypothetical protein